MLVQVTKGKFVNLHNITTVEYDTCKRSVVFFFTNGIKHLYAMEYTDFCKMILPFVK